MSLILTMPGSDLWSRDWLKAAAKLFEYGHSGLFYYDVSIGSQTVYPYGHASCPTNGATTITTALGVPVFPLYAVYVPDADPAAGVEMSITVQPLTTYDDVNIYLTHARNNALSTSFTTGANDKVRIFATTKIAYDPGLAYEDQEIFFKTTQAMPPPPRSQEWDYTWMRWAALMYLTQSGALRRYRWQIPSAQFIAAGGAYVNSVGSGNFPMVAEANWYPVNISPVVAPGFNYVMCNLHKAIGGNRYDYLMADSTGTGGGGTVSQYTEFFIDVLKVTQQLPT